ncbi:uncharacterized protein [Diadema antillarum]|uniref:uncharacterized protein n=1 Tax=Diadema antillarum TaxID=105358 RepID=UPI003A89B3BE
MTAKAARALKGLKTLSADDIGSLKSVKASELSADIRCQNHAKMVALRKQVDVWYRDQNDAVRKLAHGQQHAFRNLIKIQNEKRRLQRQSYIQKQRLVQQKLREQAVKDREAAAKKFLESTMKRGKKKLIQRQKVAEASSLNNIQEDEEEEVAEREEESQKFTDDFEKTPNEDGLSSNQETEERSTTYFYTGKSDTIRNVLNTQTLLRSIDNTPNNQNSTQSITDIESIDSGICSTDMSSELKHSTKKLNENQTDSSMSVDTLMGKRERRVTFVEDEKFVQSPNGKLDDKEETDNMSHSEDEMISESVTPAKSTKISHHHVTIVDGDTGFVEVLPREKTRIVDESNFLWKRVGGLSLKTALPSINRAYLRPSTSDNQRETKEAENETVAMTARTDSDVDLINAIADENDITDREQHTERSHESLSRTNTNNSLLPPIREDKLITVSPSTKLIGVNREAGRGSHVVSDETVAVESVSTKASISSSYDAAQSHGEVGSSLVKTETVGNDDDEGDYSERRKPGDEDDEASRREKARQKKMRERHKLEDDMHKYHVGIANRTFRIPNYEIPRVPRVPVYTRNSEGSLVASEKTVRAASEDFRLPSRRQEYLIKKALEWEEARKEIRERKLNEFLAKMKNLEKTMTAKPENTKASNHRELFHSQKRDSISHNTMNSTVFGHALITGSRYGEFGDVNDLRNCRYIRHTSIDDTSSSHDESYEDRRRKRALEKVSSWGPLGVPHGASSRLTRTRRKTSRNYVTL